jgi:omega-hydroxy-beta-dihydromenaquinone-9 sulfotransferase
MATQLKHRWSLSHNYLAGICASDWWHLLKENRFRIDPVYWHRGLFITLVSFINSFYRRKEERLHGKRIRATQITRPPLFVLGHWRSGTTHLHNLLAEDTEQFAYPNTYQVVNPHTFLCTEEVNTRRFAWLLPDHRPMDNMVLSFDAPQEDEFALLLGCFRSMYLSITFPHNEDHYDRYLTFRGVPQKDIEEWKRTFIWFTKKLTLKYGDRAIVYKSPPHTARIRLLLETFPGARFVHIHRNPYAVYRSFQHYFDTATWYTYLQRPDLESINRRILERYTVLYDAFFAERGLIPPGHYHEVSFEELETDPMGQVELLYQQLGLAGFEAFRPKLQRYVDSIAGYKKNVFKELPGVEREVVAKAWRRSFEEWGYPV